RAREKLLADDAHRLAGEAEASGYRWPYVDGSRASSRPPSRRRRAAQGPRGPSRGVRDSRPNQTVERVPNVGEAASGAARAHVDQRPAERPRAGLPDGEWERLFGCAPAATINAA